MKAKLQEIDNASAAKLLESNGTKYMINHFNMTDDFIEENQDKLEWEVLTQEYTFTEDQIMKYKSKITSLMNLNISTLQGLTDDFIEKHSIYLNWNKISYLNLTKDFIEKFPDKLNWRTLCLSMDLEESFMIKYQDKIDWEVIAYSQKLSEEFIETYFDKLDHKYLKLQNLSDEFLTKMNIGLPIEENITIDSDSLYDSALQYYNKGIEDFESQNDENKLFNSIICSPYEDSILKKLLKRKGI